MGVGREAVEDAVTIGTTVEVAVASKRVQLKAGRPIVHGFEFPFSLRCVGHGGVDTRIVTPDVEQTMSDELRDTAGSIVAVVCVNNHSRGLCSVGSVCVHELAITPQLRSDTNIRTLPLLKVILVLEQ